MQHIETVTVGSGGTASITFSAIPDTYTDLVVKCSLRGARSELYELVYLQLNGSSSSFTRRILQGTGSSVGSFSVADGYVGITSGSTSTANTFGNLDLYLPNYRSAAAKSISTDSVSENNGTGAYQNIAATLWNVTDPITSLTIIGNAGNWLEHSSASLYGITAGSDGIVAVS